MPNPADLVNLQAIKSSLLASLAAETAYEAQYGGKPSYSLDGETYNWPAWQDAVLAKVERLNKLIQLESTPWVIESRIRP